MSIAKFDVDFKMHERLFYRFYGTRMAIVEKLGYVWKVMRWKETEHGYHFWVHISNELTDRELLELQFLLGDDHKRTRFNALREEAGAFKPFNCLFNKKFHKKQRGVEGGE